MVYQFGKLKNFKNYMLICFKLKNSIILPSDHPKIEQNMDKYRKSSSNENQAFRVYGNKAK